MSVFETSPHSTSNGNQSSLAPTSTPAPAAPGGPLPLSPFSPATLGVAPAAAPGIGAQTFAALEISSPFAEAFGTFDEVDLEAEAFEALRAEFEDEEFHEALEALGDEAAARHLRASGTWAQQAQSLEMGESEATQWMESVAVRADSLLSELEAHFVDRPVGGLTEAEVDAVAGYLPSDQELANRPLEAQELFIGKLVKKVKKVVKGVGKLVKKGVRAVGKLLPLGKLFGVLKKLVRPLLERVLKKAIGELPPTLRPLATKLAARFGARGARLAGSPTPSAGPAPAAPVTDTAGDASADAAPPDEPVEAATQEAPWSAQELAAEFDATLAEAVLAPSDTVATELLAMFEAETRAVGQVDGPYTALDAGRQKLARQLVDAEPGRPPLAEMEEFVPVVMAAMKLIKLGVKVVGRQRVVGLVAKLLATLMQGLVGAQAAQQLSRPVADAGLRLLGLEAEGVADGTLGAEALVATAEDTIREVMSQPAASLENELLLEALVQEAFTSAAVRHFPAEVLRSGLTDDESPEESERGIWVMFPRQTRPHYRYKKYSLVQPVRITRSLARSVIYRDGDTLEDRLLDAGARGWPVQGEVHHYELLPGASLGHLAAFESDGEDESYAGTALEFEELVAARPLPGHHPRPSARHTGAPARPRHQGRSLAPGTRVFRVEVPGTQLRPRPPFALRLDVDGAKPTLRLHLLVSERRAHALAERLEKRQPVQAVQLLRELMGSPVRQALAARLTRVLARRGITVAEGATTRLADAMADALVRVAAEQLQTSSAALTTAAKDPAAGVTLTFAFSFDGKVALARGKVGDPVLSVRSGTHRD